MNPNIHLISRWIIKDGFQAEAEKTLREFEQMAKAEVGTLMYLIHRPMWNINLVSRPEPKQLEVLFVEIYADQSAFQKHVSRQVAYMKKANAFAYFETPQDKPEQAAEMVEFLAFERGFIKPTLKIN